MGTVYAIFKLFMKSTFSTRSLGWLFWLVPIGLRYRAWALALVIFSHFVSIVTLLQYFTYLLRVPTWAAGSIQDALCLYMNINRTATFPPSFPILGTCLPIEESTNFNTSWNQRLSKTTFYQAIWLLSAIGDIVIRSGLLHGGVLRSLIRRGYAFGRIFFGAFIIRPVLVWLWWLQRSTSVEELVEIVHEVFIPAQLLSTQIYPLIFWLRCRCCHDGLPIPHQPANGLRSFHTHPITFIRFADFTLSHSLGGVSMISDQDFDSIHELGRAFFPRDQEERWMAWMAYDGTNKETRTRILMPNYKRERQTATYRLWVTVKLRTEWKWLADTKARIVSKAAEPQRASTPSPDPATLPPSSLPSPSE